MTEETIAPEAAAGVGSTYRRLMRNRGFRRLWVSQFVSSVGDWLVVGLLIPLVNSLSNGSSFAVAGIIIAKIIPALFLSSLTGVFVDRFDRRKVMITMDIARALLALGLIATNSLAAIYLIVLLMETASLFFVPAKNALIPVLVGEEELAEANGLSYTTGQISTIVGLTASAAILAAFERVVNAIIRFNVIGVSHLVGLFSPALLGPRAGVVLDSLTFVVSAIAIWGIKVDARPANGAKGKLDLSLLGKDVRESFVFMREHRELRGLLVTIFLAIVGGGVVVTVGLVYIQTVLVGTIPILSRIPAIKSLTATPQTFFLLLLAIGMGSAAVLVPRLAHRLPLQTIFVGSVATFGTGLFLFSITTQYWIAAVFAVLAGACIATVTVAGNTYVARTTADELRGRVFTALESVIRVALLLSLIVMAPLNDLVALVFDKIALARGMPPANVALWAPRITLWLASAMVLGAAYYGFRTLSWRRAEAAEGSSMPPSSEEPRGVMEIAFPPTLDGLAALRAGDEVLLSGRVFTARDATHVRLIEELDKSGHLPFGLEGQVLYYAGPTPSSPGRPAGSVGPTTSKRMDWATPRLLDAGIMATIGKGPRSEEVRAALARNGAVYFNAVGGAAALLGSHVRSARSVAWDDLGTEALVELELDAFPAFVAIDARGNDLFSEARGAEEASSGSE